MDKFLYLIRQYLATSFRFFSKRDWRDLDLLEAYLEALANTPLNPTNGKIPDGLRYHLLDIYVDEIERVDEKREERVPIEALLRPIRELGDQSPAKAIRAAVKETLEDQRLRDRHTDGDSHGEVQHEIQINSCQAVEDATGDFEDEWGGIEE